MALTSVAIPGLPGKIGNANTTALTERSGLFCADMNVGDGFPVPEHDVTTLKLLVERISIVEVMTRVRPLLYPPWADRK